MLFGLIGIEAIFLAHNRTHICTLQDIAPKASALLFFQKLDQTKDLFKNNEELILSFRIKCDSHVIYLFKILVGLRKLTPWIGQNP